MNRRRAVKGLCVNLALAFFFFFSFAVQAAEIKCDVCGMFIGSHGRNHIILKSASQKNQIRHVCSPTCAHKLQKFSPEYSSVEVSDFNHPEKMLQGDKAYFLIQSSKIKPDMGENVMSPYAAAFNTKEEVEAAQKKYGDGTVVKGAHNAFK